jgi:phospholipase C
MRHPAVWRRAALFVLWDENGGFFDHVPPPLAPPGTPGEHLAVRELPTYAGGIRGPIGLGPRVPLLVVSPFSRGGFVASETFDATSVLQFIERRFGVEVPLLSRWRRQTSGDLTSAFNFAAPDFAPVDLPAPALTDAQTIVACRRPVPVPPIRPRPAGLALPRQEPGEPRRPSGPV